ncbi:MAG: hypothetical protein GEV08_05540 [Acidimicrobiia bacterium]|nr:hypothetical protein [Acidimicrobiia bacterium]
MLGPGAPGALGPLEARPGVHARPGLRRVCGLDVPSATRRARVAPVGPRSCATRDAGVRLLTVDRAGYGAVIGAARGRALDREDNLAMLEALREDRLGGHGPS